MGQYKASAGVGVRMLGAPGASRGAAPRRGGAASAARECFVHIGTFKTGTTSIQRFLGLNRGRLAAAGVALPRSGCDNAPDYVSHHQLAYELAGRTDFDARYGGIAALERELAHSTARTAVLSSEVFCALFGNLTGLVRLRDAIRRAGFRPRIVCYLRPQAAYCRADYAQIVCYGGYRKPFEAYLEATLADGAYSPAAIPLDYCRLLDPFAHVFGRDAMIVRSYKANPRDASLLIDFARLLADPNEIANFAVPPTRENATNGFRAVVSALGGVSPTPELAFAPLRIVDILRLFRRFRRSNADAGARYGVNVPVLEPHDLALASPLRRTWRRTFALHAMRAVVGCAGGVRDGCRTAVDRHR